MATTAQRRSHSNGKQAMSNSSTNVVGVHYKVGRKLGEGSFGIIYEGNGPRTNQSSM
jgi:casein kinase 1